MQTRRTFIQRSGLVILGAATGLAGVEKVKAEVAITKPVMIIDLNRCTGCQSCVVSCKGHSMTAPEKFNTRLITMEKDNSPAQVIFTPVQCNQCDDPPCVPACPVNATFKLDNGIVVTDWDKCQSTGDCIAACPYEARFADSRHGQKVDKCDFCMDRLMQGLEPACVEACSSGARIFGDVNNPQGEFASYLRDKELVVRMPEKQTKPNVLYIKAGQGREELV
ncbi:MAG: 4Fe-4S dicluster domain-containing protein [Thermodesulfobacteriota bacterium]|nr:4Fe-4S dicluster domain-containing protein [Thermodesulfobacteriota bacterium]